MARTMGMTENNRGASTKPKATTTASGSASKGPARAAATVPPVAPAAPVRAPRATPQAPTRSSNYAPPKADRFGTKMGGSHMTQQAVGAVGAKNASLRKAGVSALRSSLTKKK